MFDPPPKETDDPLVLEHHFDFSQWVWIHHVEKNDTTTQRHRASVRDLEVALILFVS